jgi:hypothetical protein
VNPTCIGFASTAKIMALRTREGSRSPTIQTGFTWSQAAKTFSPLLRLLDEHVSPERLYLETKWGSLISFELAADLLKDTLPIAETVNGPDYGIICTGSLSEQKQPWAMKG